MAKKSSGLVKLEQWLSSAKGPKATAALRAVGVSGSNVRSWRAGLGRPGAAIRRVLELLAGIPYDAWHTERERLQIEAAEQIGRV